ncbi:MAG: class I SAM-dependent methyltransferase [Jatrophihabitans sp.]|uniref:class I SAM-dependent methyltransferase n=1 Tax=Jatrophihabitans sp. TaxID=1932789 RepID=UPI00391448F6
MNAAASSLGSGRTAAEVLGPLLRRALNGEVPFRLRFWDGSVTGPDSPSTMVIVRRRALRRLLWSPDEIGLARAYVTGDLDVEGDLFAVLSRVLELIRPDDVVGERPGLRTLAALAGAAVRLGVVGPPPRPPKEEVRLRGHRHTRRRDAEAIAHHYDVGNDFYRLVLGDSMTYSCAYWAPPAADAADPDHLTVAQFAKCDLVARKLGLAAGMRVLDVGCGWGTFALHAARTYGAQVVGVTLSSAQADFARRRMMDEGVADLVEIRVQDYRDIRDGPFDAVSSIGMAEHVGSAMLPHYAADLFALLRPRGRLLNHAIALRPDDPQQGPESSSFIDRYVFPDGELVPIARMISVLEDAGFEVRDVESLREHYALTLRAWCANLDRSWDAAVRASTPVRARVWRLYMTAAAMSFESNDIGVNQVLGVRPDDRGRSGFPLTRGW